MNGLRRLAVALTVAGALTFVAGASAIPLLDLLLPGKAPGAVAQPATNVTVSGGQLNGTVHPNGHGTKYFFEYGPTIAYGNKTKEIGISGGASWTAVSATLTGLQEDTTYHFRVVAKGDGTTRSPDVTFKTASSAPPPGGDPGPGTDPGTDPGTGPGTPGSSDPGSPATGGRSDAVVEPKLGKSVLVAPGDGELFVRKPGSSAFKLLESGSELPMGTEVDATNGSIALTSALPGGHVQTGQFGGGRFVIRQSRGGYVDLYLRGRVCQRSKAKYSLTVASAARRKPKRRLWGSDHGGRFRTHGKNSHATVRGTRWVVGDSCAGTLTRVSSGQVVVRDTVRRKNVVLDAGERYLARPRHKRHH